MPDLLHNTTVMPRRFATADIGSNTAHLLIAEIENNQIRRLMNESVWLSLGEVVSKNGHIPIAQANLLVDTIKKFKADSDSHGVEQLYVFATEAMRIATNHLHVLQRVREETGVTVELISSRRESELSVLGIYAAKSFDHTELMIEVGGGSTQLAAVRNATISEQVSLKLGTGRLIALSNLEFPATPRQIGTLLAAIREELAGSLSCSECRDVVACGGVSRGLLRALHPDGQLQLQIFELEYIIQACTELTIQQISRRFNVKAKRAQSLIPGALIYSQVLKHYGFEKMRISEFGVREGALLELANAVKPI